MMLPIVNKFSNNQFNKNQIAKFMPKVTSLQYFKVDWKLDPAV